MLVLAEKKGAQSHVYQIHEYIGNQTQDSKKDHIIAWFQLFVTVGNVPTALKTIFIFQTFVLTYRELYFIVKRNDIFW